MVQRTGFNDSALIRTLARLADTDVRASKDAFADRMGQWLAWTDAIALSGALNSTPAAPHANAAATPADTEAAECARVREALAKSITRDVSAVAGRPRGAAPAIAAQLPPPDFAPYRWRYQARQQAMEAAIAPLRERLCATLATRSPALARLAAVDAVMAPMLDAQAQRLLAGLPTLLEKHFDRLRDAAADNDRWLTGFHQDMQSLLLAELDFRFQPVEGLLAALRQPEHP